MSATDIQRFNPLAIAGLGKTLRIDDMNASQVMYVRPSSCSRGIVGADWLGQRYNGLRNIRDQPRLEAEHIDHVKALLEIIQLHGMGDHFGIHAAHRHDAIPVGTIRLETDLGIHGFTWTTPTSVESTDASKLHATLFKVGQDGFTPFEFAEGPSPLDVTKVPAAFLAEFAAYIAKHELADLIVLEVGDFAKRGGAGATSTAEIEVQWGEHVPFTVVVPTAFLSPGGGNLVGTGWSVPGAVKRGPKPYGPPPGEHWHDIVDKPETHRVYFDAIGPVTPEALVKALGEQGILVAAPTA